MAKYYKGEIVKIITSGAHIDDYTGGWTHDMTEFVGQYGAVKEVIPFPDGNTAYRLTGLLSVHDDGENFIFDERTVKGANRW